jgi:hypothetical protein
MEGKENAKTRLCCSTKILHNLMKLRRAYKQSMDASTLNGNRDNVEVPKVSMLYVCGKCSLFFTNTNDVHQPSYFVIRLMAILCILVCWIISCFASFVYYTFCLLQILFVLDDMMSPCICFFSNYS